MDKRTLISDFADPPREFGIIPFWFWNDDLEEQELVRQIREFHAKGFGGFIPHARIGLSRRVGYLTEEYFRLLRLAVEEAQRLGMKVVLYDEGSYPSGSAQGRVVAENPEFAARCLIALQKTIPGPWRAADASGQPVNVGCPADWARLREWETFSGTLHFTTDFELSPVQLGHPLFLDLGRVADIAEVLINGQHVGVRAWAPYVLEIGRTCCSGPNSLEVRVTNSMANAYEGLQMPSGLVGPVVLRAARTVAFRSD